MQSAILVAIAILAAELNNDSPEVKDFLGRCHTLRVDLLTERDGKGDGGVFLDRLPMAHFSERIRVGDIGAVDRAKVLQILDPKTARCEIHWDVNVKRKVVVGEFPDKRTYFVLQAIDQKKEVVIRGINFEDMADDDSFRPRSVLRVTKTESFDSAIGGNRTLHVLEPIDVSKWLPKPEELPHVKRSSETPDTFRTWKDSKGEVLAEAEFVDFKNNKVILKKRDGSTLETSSAALSKSDQDFYRQELKNRKSKKG